MYSGTSASSIVAIAWSFLITVSSNRSSAARRIFRIRVSSAAMSMPLRTADRPNQRWVGDTSEFLVGNGTKLFVAAILDLFSRYVVGWAVNAVNDRHLTIKALEMAVQRRCPAADLLFHSDQGCTYAS